MDINCVENFFLIYDKFQKVLYQIILLNCGKNWLFRMNIKVIKFVNSKNSKF